ncbi:unnamed protein product [Bursaphelenchus xylophilus]|uniref:(pine wood nematode) hypothetical protein n=1 Tax=Bursaphelenchus xylophilus TaxID=6326 RepID=A0A1I7RP85_BURXY|nr:unnamed protein product [Bursaphelenchus xylophilus]CAG9095581.1 unnamed protein product [Bursaphelenchus xylophilus]
MRVYKYHVIHFTIYDFIFSFNLGTLIKPDTIFPFNGAYVKGWYRYFGDNGATICMISIIVTGGHAITTQCICLVYRFAVLLDTRKLLALMSDWKAYVIGYVISTTIYTLISVFIFAKIVFPVDEVHRQILEVAKIFPNATLPDFNQVILYLPPTTEHSLGAAIFIFCGFMTAEFVSVGSVYMLLRKLESKKASFSKATYRLHRQLTIALGLQLSTPFFFIMAPVSYWVVVNYPYGYMDYSTSRLFLLYIEMYGTCNSAITLYFVKPYRNLVTSKIRMAFHYATCRRYGKEEEILVVMPPESTLVSSGLT